MTGEAASGGDRPASTANGWARVAAAVLVAALVPFLVELVWRLRFDTNDDLAFAFMLWGRTELPAQTEFYFFFRGLGALLVALVRNFGPSAYGAFLTGLLVVASARWFARILEQRERWSDGTRVAAALVISMAVVAAIFGQLSFTRIAFLCVFVGFQGWSAALERERWSLAIALDLALVVFGYAIRPQSGLLALGIVGMLWLFEGLSRRRILGQAALAIGVVLAFKAYDAVALDDTDREYVKRYQLAVDFVDFGSELVEELDEVDGDRYQMIRNWILFDGSFYNSEYLTSLTQYIEPASSRIGKRLAALDERAWLVLGLAPWWAGPALFWVVAGALYSRGRRSALLIAGKVVSVFLCLVVIDVLFTSRLRVIEPALAALLLDVFTADLRRGPPDRWRREPWNLVPTLSIAVIAVGFAVTAFRNVEARAEFDDECERTRVRLETLERVTGDRTLLLGHRWAGMFNENHPLRIRFLPQHVRVLITQGWVTQFDDCARLVDAIGRGRGVGGMLERMKTHPDDFVFVFSKNSRRLFLKHAKKTYGVELEMEDRRDYRLNYRVLVPTSPR